MRLALHDEWCGVQIERTLTALSEQLPSRRQGTGQDPSTGIRGCVALLVPRGPLFALCAYAVLHARCLHLSPADSPAPGLFLPGGAPSLSLVTLLSPGSLLALGGLV